MKKKTKTIVKIIIAVIVIVIAAFVAFGAYLAHTWQKNTELGQYILEEGPWSSENTWVSDDGESYLVAEKENEDDAFSNVYAYFVVDGEWNEYELNIRKNLCYIDKVEDGVTVEGYGGEMEFDGTTFVITNLDEAPKGHPFGKDEFRYTITDEVFEYDE